MMDTKELNEIRRWILMRNLKDITQGLALGSAYVVALYAFMWTLALLIKLTIGVFS